jgi:hypothetical protein
MDYISNSNASEDKVFVYPFYYGWILDYYKEIGEYSKINHQDYGWEFHGIMDSVKSQHAEKFWFIIDYHSFDTSSYTNKLQELEKSNNLELKQTFYIQPEKVVLYKCTEH